MPAGWHAHPGFVAANAERVADARRRLPPELQRVARIVFTAHSIPKSMADACRYEAELLESARLVAMASGRLRLGAHVPKPKRTPRGIHGSNRTSATICGPNAEAD